MEGGVLARLGKSLVRLGLIKFWFGQVRPGVAKARPAGHFWPAEVY